MDRRVILGLGAAAALAAGLLIAWFFLKRDGRSSEPPPAAVGGLVVETGRDDDLTLDFVNGQFVGELPLAVCAQRNGVATGALDVGVDASGALAASNGVSANLTPLPPTPQTTVTQTPGAANAAVPAPAPQAAGEPEAPTADCWRYAPGGWRELPGSMTQAACVQVLYAGHCQGRNEAMYGRWGNQTLRLTDGRVEISSDNRDFDILTNPWPGCGSG
jgi:hypothetical protein